MSFVKEKADQLMALLPKVSDNCANLKQEID
jgi:hypothetical protein